VRPYLVWSFDYYDDSAGQKTMHRLCHELNEAGQEAYVAYEKRNPAWNTPYHSAPLSGDWIAVYPEIIKGNPWKAPRVVRYVLNNPGKLGGDKVYDPAEIVYVFHELFNDVDVPPERILFLPTIELDLYFDRHLPREGAVFYVGKGQQTRDLHGAVEITNDLKRDRRLLAETLNRAEVMYTFDPVSAMNEIARLCGSKVVFVPGSRMTKDEYRQFVAYEGGFEEGFGWDEIPPPFDSGISRQRQIELYYMFCQRLQDFIAVTQA
jgi:hypothetical protein